MTVALSLVGSAVVSGALAGFGLGVALLWLPSVGIEAGNTTLVILVVLAVAADLAWSATGRFRPLRVDGQVPRQWSSIFSAPVTAGLYGSRLGVGPLTLLNTWMWWAASLGAALLGVVPSVAAGAVFAAVKTILIVATSLWAEGADHQPRFDRLRRIRAGRPLGLIGAAAAAVLLLGACTEGSRPEFAQDGTDPTIEVGRVERSATEVTEPAPTRITPPPSSSAEDSVSEPSAATSTTTSTTGPPTTGPTSGSPSSEAATTVTDANADGPITDDPLAAALLAELPGFDPIDDPAADRPLDIDAAANIQPDPTEELPLLETRGFAGGWTRAFRNQTRDVIVTTVYEFVDNEEAAFYLEDGLITIGGYGGQFFEVPDIEGSRGFRQAIDGDEPLLSVGVTFVRANRWYLVYIIGDAESVVPDDLIEAARLQAARVTRD